MDLRKILAEAIAAGIAAREAKMAELFKEAEEKDWPQYNCGFSWMNIDPEICVQVHALGLPRVATNYPSHSCSFPELVIKDLSAEGAKLYLQEVSDYQCLSTSLAGLEAAAEVLHKYGLTARAEGMLD